MTLEKQHMSSAIGSKEVVLLLLIRLAVLSLALLTTTFYMVFVSTNPEFPIELIYTLIAILFAFCAISGSWLLSKKSSAFVSGMQFIADALVVSLVIYMSGGVHSGFHVLYLPVVLGVALFMNQSWAIGISVLSGSMYGAILLACHYGLLPPLVAHAQASVPAYQVYSQIIGLFSGVLLTTLVTIKLRSVLKSSEALATRSHKYIEELQSEKQMLLAHLPQAAFTLDNNGIVIHHNEAASDFCNNDEMIGVSLCNLLQANFKDCPINISDLPLNAQVCFHTQNGDARTFQVSSQTTMHGFEEGNTTTVMFRDITQLLAVEKQLELQERMLEMREKQEEYQNPLYEHVQNSFIGKSPVMQKVFSLIHRVATSDASVLISGESGTGKELAARAIHLQSGRASYPFVAINCGAFPENLLESELFGHKKGSFTGAVTDHKGLFQQAEGGTLFLDEIGELPLHMQTKLLRALQEKIVRPVGGTTEIPVDVRVISATNRNLKKEVETGNFREDLFYRLNVIGITLPALREREGDIPLLIDAICTKLAKGPIPEIGPDATAALLNYSYPGNVRELENILEQALVLGGDQIALEHLPEAMRSPATEIASLDTSETRPITEIIEYSDFQLPLDLDSILAEIEKQCLVMALKETDGAKKKAAELLGINFRSFRYRLQKFDIASDN